VAFHCSKDKQRRKQRNISAMRKVSIALLSLFILYGFSAAAEEPDDAKPDDAKALNKCDVGPVIKTYGQGKWLVFSCDDDMTLLVLAAPDNPIKPFMFVLEPDSNGGYGVFFDESTGKNDASAAALAQLKALSPQDIASLIKETKPPAK
jgi:hypothetical protein